MYPSSVGNVIIHATSFFSKGLFEKTQKTFRGNDYPHALYSSFKWSSSSFSISIVFPVFPVLLTIEMHFGKVMGSDPLMELLRGALWETISDTLSCFQPRRRLINYIWYWYVDRKRLWRKCVWKQQQRHNLKVLTIVAVICIITDHKC